MRRIITLFATCVLVAVTANLQAQTDGLQLRNEHHMSRTMSPAQKRHMDKILQHQQANPTMAAHKTTIQKQRLRAESHFYVQGTGLIDSTVFTYTNDRGSAFDFLFMEYNKDFHYPVLFDKYINFDTAYDYNTGFPTPHGRTYRTYSATGKTLTEGDDYDAHSFTYDAQDQVSARYDLSRGSSASAWDTSEISFFTHSGQNVMIDSLVSWTGSGWENDYKDVYSYNTGNSYPTAIISYDWDGSAWVEEEKAEVTYTVDNLLETVLFSGNYGSGWEEESKETFAFNNGQLTTKITYEWDGSNWETSSEEHRHLNAGNLPDSVSFLNQQSGSWDTMYAKISYNSFGNPTSIATFNAEMEPDEISRYYYEEYSTQVGAIASIRPLTIYPNPAKDQLYIQQGTLQAGRLHYAILNSLGQIVMQVSGTSEANQQIAIPVQQLQPGIYWIKVQDAANGVHSASFTKE